MQKDPAFQLKINTFRLNKQKSIYMLLVKDTPKIWNKILTHIQEL